MKSHRKAKSKKRRQQRGHGSIHRDMNRNHTKEKSLKEKCDLESNAW